MHKIFDMLREGITIKDIRPFTVNVTFLTGGPFGNEIFVLPGNKGEIRLVLLGGDYYEIIDNDKFLAALENPNLPMIENGAHTSSGQSVFIYAEYASCGEYLEVYWHETEVSEFEGEPMNEKAICVNFYNDILLIRANDLEKLKKILKEDVHNDRWKLLARAS